MNQIKIGVFIAKCRKDKKLTQAQLAEKLGITDRAVSKWETGKGMPDSSIMLELCEILEISVNELLSGEMIEMKDYDKKAEENLLNMAKREEMQNKKLLFYENIIGIISSVTFIVLIIVAAYLVQSLIARIVLFIIAFLIFIMGVSVALKIETEAGYYECENCHNKYIPSYKSVYFAMHIGKIRYLKCPKCGKRTWNKKVLKK